MLSLIILIGFGYGSFVPENTETAVVMPLINNENVSLVAKLDTKNLNKTIKTYIDKTVDKAVIGKIPELKLDEFSTVIKGNSRIHEITTKDEYELYILMEDFAGETRYARKFFRHLQHSSQPFSTLDRGSSSNCAKAHFGGWWYKNCHHSNLNGLYLNGSHKSYADGIEWYHWKGYNYSSRRHK
ncbi:unnamed protein product [Mytilus edulis]|uniref:Fibrinogen C-terminal domain-containing protein n=1 Tax=Mytilus edulis TaxID=6550 RepID=A0A8S3R5Q2_MYTED|nr:unnamed protein product [Mytilus edulis]